MGKLEIKERAYELFDKGLQPQDVIVKLNVPGEAKVVWGCWTYYKRKSNTNKYKTLLEDKERISGILAEQKECISSILNGMDKLLELNNSVIYSDISKRADEYCTIRQYEIHRIENGIQIDNNEMIELIRLLSVTRRTFKYVDALNKNLSGIKNGIKNTHDNLKAVYDKELKMEDGDAEQFLEHRVDGLSEISKRILEELSED